MGAGVSLRCNLPRASPWRQAFAGEPREARMGPGAAGAPVAVPAVATPPVEHAKTQTWRRSNCSSRKAPVGCDYRYLRLARPAHPLPWLLTPPRCGGVAIAFHPFGTPPCALAMLACPGFAG